MPERTETELRAVTNTMHKIAVPRMRRGESSLLGTFSGQNKRQEYSPNTVAMMAKDAGRVTTAFVHENKNEHRLP